MDKLLCRPEMEISFQNKLNRVGGFGVVQKGSFQRTEVPCKDYPCTLQTLPQSKPCSSEQTTWHSAAAVTTNSHTLLAWEEGLCLGL